MQEMQIEIGDNVERSTEHHNGTIVTAGSPTTITLASNKPIQLTYIYNPEVGSNKNNPSDVLYISWDGTNYTALSNGNTLIWPGKGFGSYGSSIKINSNNNGVKYEVMIVS